MKNTLAVVVALLDGVALGGLAAILMARELLLTIMYRLNTPTAQAEILNVLDHLLPYVLAYAAATVVMALVTVLVGFAFAMRGTQKPVGPARLA